MNRLGRGLRPSTPARIAHRMGALSHPGIAERLGAGLTGSADLEPFCPSVTNQYAKEVCFAFSLSSAIACARAAKGRPLGFVPSQALIASLVYAKEQRRSKPPGTSWQGLLDVGAELQDGADIVATWGVAPMGAAVSDSNADLPDGPFAPNAPGAPPFPEANVKAAIEASAQIIDGEYQIAVNQDAPSLIAASLDAAIPVWTGGLVGGAFEGLGPSDVAEPTPTSERGAGGHAQFFSGYSSVAKLLASSNPTFVQAAKNALAQGWTTTDLLARITGSWGTGWGDAGRVWVSPAWQRAQWNLFPMAVV